MKEMTEIDKEKLKIIAELKTQWQKKSADAKENYQGTGIQRYYSTYKKYDDYCDILDLAEKQLNETNNQFSKRDNNLEYLKSSLSKETYTKEEVIDLLGKTLFM